MKKRMIILFLLLIGIIACINISYSVLLFYIITIVISYLFVTVYYRLTENNDMFNLLIVNTIWFPVYRLCYVTFLDDEISYIINHVISAFNQFHIVEINVLTREQCIWVSSVFFLILTSVFYHYLNMDKTGMKISPFSIKDDIPDKNFPDRRKVFCRHIINRLESINRELNWSDEYFTPLNADIQMLINNKTRKRTIDLLKALKACNNRTDSIYLLIGDPGSGKSVTLRKLCIDLMGEVGKTGKIPIYVNLKEWNRAWDINHIPTPPDVEAFVVSYLKKSGGTAISGFIDDYFNQILLSGRWFFIFDSFDEIPSLIGSSDTGYINEMLSKAIYDFMFTSNCSGVVASRPFRSPAPAFKYNVLLNIKPYNDNKVEQFFNNYMPAMSKDTIKKIYLHRYDMIQIARNPFYASLIVSYMKNNGDRYPENQNDLFEDFIYHRLSQNRDYLYEMNADKVQVEQAAEFISYYMFSNTSAGLEADIESLKASYHGNEEDTAGFCAAIKVLAHIKICRMDEMERTITFVHRRFQEYFYIKNNINFNLTSYEDIPNNTRFRDVLILYCEVADNNKATEIARYCWNIIRSNGTNFRNIMNINCMKSINCLNFLSEAFRRRKKPIMMFQKKLTELIKESLNEDQDLVCVAQFSNAIHLFSSDSCMEIIYRIFDLEYIWIDEIAISNFYYFKQIWQSLVVFLFEYIDSIPTLKFIRQYKSIMFDFSISDAFKRVKKYIRLRCMDLVLPLIDILFLLFIFKYIAYSLRIFLLNINILWFFMVSTVSLLISFCTNKDAIESFFRMLHMLIATLLYSVLQIKYNWEWDISPLIAMFLSFSIRDIYSLGWEIADKRMRHNHKIKSKNKELKTLLSIIVLSMVFGIFLHPFMNRFFPSVYINYSKFYFLYMAFFAVYYLLRYLFRFILSLIVIKHNQVKGRITRSKLERIMNKIAIPRLRVRYLQDLINRKIVLEGLWIGNIRPSYADELSTVLIIELDIGKKVNRM